MAMNYYKTFLDITYSHYKYENHKWIEITESEWLRCTVNTKVLNIVENELTYFIVHIGEFSFARKIHGLWKNLYIWKDKDLL